MEIDKTIKEIARKHAGLVEQLTIEQFEDALVGAILSGDFVRCVQNDGGISLAQGMTYIPFRGNSELIAENARLKRIIEDFVGGEADY